MGEYLRQIAGFRREIRLFLLYNLFSNIGIGVFSLIFNLYLVKLSLREDFIGTFSALSTVAMGIVALGMGYLINRFGSWTCITYGTVLFLVTSAIVSVIANPHAILAFGILSGAATAFLFVPVMPYIVEWARPDNRGTVAALAFSLQSLSGTVGHLVGGWSPRLFAGVLGLEVDSVATYRLTLLAGLGLAAIGLLPMWLLRSTRRGRSEESGSYALISELPPSRRQIRRDIAVFVAAGLFLSFGAGAVVPFYNVFLESIGARPSQIGMIFSLAGIIAAVTGLFAPALSQRFGPLNAVLILRLAPVPAFALLTIEPTLGIAVMAHVVRMTSISMAWPIDSTFITEILPGAARANAFSLRSGAWNLGFALSSIIAGQVIVSRGYAPTFVAFTLFSVVSLVTFVGYFSRHPALRKDPERQPEPVSTS